MIFFWSLYGSGWQTVDVVVKWLFRLGCPNLDKGSKFGFFLLLVFAISSPCLYCQEVDLMLCDAVFNDFFGVLSSLTASSVIKSTTGSCLTLLISYSPVLISSVSFGGRTSLLLTLLVSFWLGLHYFEALKKLICVLAPPWILSDSIFMYGLAVKQDFCRRLLAQSAWILISGRQWSLLGGDYYIWGRGICNLGGERLVVASLNLLYPYFVTTCLSS